MKKFLLTVLVAMLTLPAFALPERCPPTKVKALPDDSTIIFYRTHDRKHKLVYVPLMNLTDKTLTPARTLQMPKDLTLYELPTNKAIQVRFSQVHDDVDYDICRSMGTETKTEAKNVGIDLFASKPISAQFDFTPDEKMQNQFRLTIANPCVSDPKKIDKKNIDIDGAVLCDADELLAVSHFFGKIQFWGTKQYRSAIGFAVNSATDQNAKPVQMTEDCARCKD